MGFEKFFYGQMQNYLDKLKMIEWNSLDITCKNEWAIFTCWISFTGPLFNLPKGSLIAACCKQIKKKTFVIIHNLQHIFNLFQQTL